MPDKPVWYILERDCVAEWLEGLRLVDGSDECDCFSTDPFPPADFPHVRNNKRRYFHYRTIAKLLGATGGRTKLPKCVQDRIAEMYGDQVGAATKVGYVQDP